MIVVLLLFYPFLPKYIGFAIGSEGLALSFRRIMLVIVFLFFLTQVFSNGRLRLERQSFAFLSLYLSTILVASINGLLSGGASAAIFRAAENTILAVIGVMLGREALRALGWSRLIRYAFLWPLLVVVPLAIIERATGYSAYFELFSHGEVVQILDMDAYRLRDGIIRSQASFGSTIVLAEYLVLSLPGLLYLDRLRHHPRWTKFLIAVVIIAILTTSSRAGIGFAVILFITHFALVSCMKYHKVRRVFASAFVGIAWLSLLCIILYYVQSLDLEMSFLAFDSDAQRSNHSRLLQYWSTLEILRDDLLLGIGYSRNFVSDLQLHALDNFYLWFLLESGLFGLACLTGMIAMTLRCSIGVIRQNISRDVLPVGVMLTEFFFLFSMYKLFALPPDNLFYFFFFAGALFAFSSSASAGPYNQKIGY